MRVSLELKDFSQISLFKRKPAVHGQGYRSHRPVPSLHRRKVAVRHAMERIRAALKPRGSPSFEVDLPADSLGVKMAVSGYVLARIIISCARDRGLAERLARYEAQRAYALLLDEDPETRDFVAAGVGMETVGSSLSVPRYVEVVAGLREERWRLVNRDVHAGQVQVTPEEMDELIRERIRVILERQLPLKVPGKVCGMLQQQTDEVTAAFRASILEQFGAVEERSAFPPASRLLSPP